MLNVIQQGAVQDQRGTRTGQQGGVMEADGMGCGFEGEGKGLRSACAPKQLFGGGDAPIQRRVVDFREQTTRHVDQPAMDAAKRVAAKLDGGVDQAREQALNWPAFEGKGGHLGRWYQTAQRYNDDPEQDIDFVHARFGYAVETLACKDLSPREEGLDVSFQVCKGMTRPDVILKLPDSGKEVAWIDITAERSEGHIKKKGKQGWSTKPYVAEVLYPSMDPKEILTGMEDPTVRRMGRYKRNQQSIRDEAREKYKAGLKDRVAVKKQRLDEKGGSQTKKREEMKNFFTQEEGMDLGSKCNVAMKGAVRYLGFNSPGDFGLKSIKTSSQEQLVNFIWQKSESISQERIGGLERDESQLQQPTFDKYGFHSDVNLLMNAGLNEETMLLRIATETSLEALEQLRSAQLRLYRFMNDEGGVKGMYYKIGIHLLSRPLRGEIKPLQVWTKEAKALLQWANEYLQYQESEGIPDYSLLWSPEKEEKEEEKKRNGGLDPHTGGDQVSWNDFLDKWT